MRDEGTREDASRKSQRLPGKYKGPKGGAPTNPHRGPWPDRSGTTLCTQMEILIGGEPTVANVEGGETYLRAGGIHIRDVTIRFLKRGN